MNPTSELRDPACPVEPSEEGHVTFLFTDVESSTDLTHRLGERYIDVLVEHRNLLRDAARAAGGRFLDCRGDEIFATFDTPEAAVGAAVTAQRAFAAHEWPEGGEVRVRMSIHTGEAIYADGGYIGFDVHRGARLCQAGHGAQVLVSDATGHLLDGVELRDLGTHWLRGLPEPERIFQLVAPGLPTEFPPLRGVATRRPSAEATVVLGDDSVLLREGIARLLEESGFAVAAQADDLDALLTAVAETQPDVVIADLRMPPSYSDEGLQAARAIRRRHPGTAVLVLSQYAEPAYARELLADGAAGVGYLLKDRVADVNEFAAAVRQVFAGGAAIDREVVSLLGDPEQDWSAVAFPRA